VCRVRASASRGVRCCFERLGQFGQVLRPSWCESPRTDAQRRRSHLSARMRALLAGNGALPACRESDFAFDPHRQDALTFLERSDSEREKGEGSSFTPPSDRSPCSPLTRGGSPVREIRSPGSVRGAASEK
jgi:hypothetical protein